MGRGEETRERIVATAAGVFNERGFAGASMADLMAATGLQKGGIYRHFESKEALALEAFDHAIARMSERFAAAVRSTDHSVDRLHAIAEVFVRIPEDPPIPGGCPLMNAVIECDDAHTPLRDRAHAAMDGLRDLLRRTTLRGIERGEIRADVDAEALATVMVSMLEGAVALSQACADPVHVRRAREHLEWYLEERVRA
ncbi:MAG: TetR/AcrR family transcriptional regulator [Gemmatimonadetes bacterium]|nr:TetR/AcrR family transcriptional regulator [Gemmatimonadota bacterium]